MKLSELEEVTRGDMSSLDYPQFERVIDLEILLDQCNDAKDIYDLKNVVHKLIFMMEV